MFLCEAGKIGNSGLEFYALKLLEFKDLKQNHLSVQSYA